MPIVVKHQAAGIAPSQENPRLKYGMMMTMQQQRADQEMRQRAQDAQYDMQRMGMMAQNQVPRQPSLGEESVMLDQEIRSGMYDPDTVKALRDDERAIRLIMRDRNIDATQRAQALENIQSRIRMARSTGKIQPMVQSRPALQGQQMQQPAAPVSAREAFRNDPKLFNEYKSRAQAFFDGSEKTPTPQMILDRAAQEYEAEQAWFNSSPSQGQSQPSVAPTPNAPAGQPQASVPQAMANERWGAREFGVENVLATPASPPIPGVATGASLPPQYQNAIYTAEMQERDRSNPPIQPIPNAVPGSPGNYLQYASQPQRSANMVYTAEDQERIRRMPPSEITPNWATGTQFDTVPYLSQPAQQQQPMYLMEAISGMKVDPNYKAKPDSGFMSPRTFTSADGRSMVGSVVGINPPSSNGGFSTVQIRKESDGKVYDVPLNNLSQQDQQYVLSGGNRDIMYDLQNPNRSSGTNFMDPNNPVRREMSAADQSIVNPQKQTLGKTGGRWGMGMVDYGINPATGNRVTASIRPGSTMPEYDPPGPTKEQVESDNAAKQKQRDFNEKVRKSQGRSAGNKTLVAGGVVPQGGQMQPGASQDAPALTQLLSTMTPSQRRDYSKWLMEEPDRYAMRNQIAQQQLNRTATAAAGSGQLPAYPGLQKRIQERNQQQGGAPMQGQMPMQGNLGQQSPPFEMGIEQALAIARNPNASAEDQKKAANVMVQSGITTVDQAKEVVGRVPSPPVTDQGVVPSPNDPQYQNKRGETSPYPYSETYEGGATSPQRPSESDVLDAYELLRNNPVSNRALTPEMESAIATLRAYGLQEEDISNLRKGYPVQGNAGDYAIVKAYETVRNSKDSTRRLSPETSAAMDVLKKNGYSDGQIASIKAGGSSKKPPAVKKLEAEKEPPIAESSVQQDSAVKTDGVNVRKWTSADGKKTFDGSLVGLSYDSVDGRRVAVFNSTDGQVFKIPIENLSEDDQSRLLAASAIEKATDRQSGDYSKYGVKIGVGEKYIAPKTSSKSRPSKGSGRGTSTDPSSKWPEEVIRSIPETTARKAKRTS